MLDQPAPGLGDRHVRILAVIMGLLAMPLLSMLVLSPVAIIKLLMFDSVPLRDGEGPIFVFVIAFCFVLGLYGLAMAIIARGLWKQRHWAGSAAAIICITWLPLGLLPLTVYGLFALLRRPVRDAWTKPAPAAYPAYGS